MKTITEGKIKKYFSITEQAFEKAKSAPIKELKNQNSDPDLKRTRDDFLDTVNRYIRDAKYFEEQGKIVEAFAALNYAHGWLDAGAKLGLWIVDDGRLFAGVDKE